MSFSEVRLLRKFHFTVGNVTPASASFMPCWRCCNACVSISYSANNQVPLTFDFCSDHVHLVGVVGSGSQESNPVTVTHAASVHLRYLIITAEPMSNLQNEEHPVAFWHVLLKLLVYSSFHKLISEYLCSFTSRSVWVWNVVPRLVRPRMRGTEEGNCT